MDDPMTVAAALVVVANRIVEGILIPIRQRYPGLDLWWGAYLSWLIGGLLLFGAGINLFPMFPELLGRLVTAIAIGGGASLLSDGIDVVKSLKRQYLRQKPV